MTPQAMSVLLTQLWLMQGMTCLAFDHLGWGALGMAMGGIWLIATHYVKKF
jgi:hypothetical protein